MSLMIFKLVFFLYTPHFEKKSKNLYLFAFLLKYSFQKNKSNTKYNGNIRFRNVTFGSVKYLSPGYKVRKEYIPLGYFSVFKL